MVLSLIGVDGLDVFALSEERGHFDRLLEFVVAFLVALGMRVRLRASWLLVVGTRKWHRVGVANEIRPHLEPQRGLDRVSSRVRTGRTRNIGGQRGSVRETPKALAIVCTLLGKHSGSQSTGMISQDAAGWATLIDWHRDAPVAWARFRG